MDEKFSISQLVRDGNIISKGKKVRLPMFPEATIYGFLAILEDYMAMTIDMPPMGTANVLSNRAIFNFGGSLHRFPIFTSVGICDEEKYNIYGLFLPKLYDHRYYDVYRIYSRCEKANDPKIVKINNIKIIDKKAFYYPIENELIFKSKSKFKAIASAFAVVTVRKSDKTDQLVYELYNPDDVISCEDGIEESPFKV